MPSRSKYLVALAALAAAFAALLPSTAAAGDRSILTAVNPIESPIVAKLNQIRRAHGLRAVQVSFRLVRAADSHSSSMARDGYFSHDSADGTVFWKRIARFYPRGFHPWTVGENLVWSSGDLSAARAVELWMASPPHRAVILSRSWKQIGVSAVHMTHAGGVYGGSDVTIVTADFGAR